VGDWLLLHYKLPTEPSARRVSVWRKLKRLGAALLHDAVWVLPATERTREQLQWLAAEIVELEGEALVWEATLAQPGQADGLVRQFLAHVEPAYHALLTDLAGDAVDLATLSRRYQQTKASDYFHSPLGEAARAALLAAGGEIGGGDRCGG
jgi:DNA-binding transcriptional regulator PaaX